MGKTEKMYMSAGVQIREKFLTGHNFTDLLKSISP